MFPAWILILSETSITLTEHDDLKREDPKRYWELYYWLRERSKRAKEEMDKLKDKAQGYSGERLTGSVAPEHETSEEDYSEFIKGEDMTEELLKNG